MKGIIGKKIGMTSVFEPNGKQTACTIIEAGPCVVTQKKTVENDGYSALQIAYGEKKVKNTPNAMVQHFAKAQTTPKSCVKELRDTSIEKEVGESITLEAFTLGGTDNRNFFSFCEDVAGDALTNFLFNRSISELFNAG